jgi:hypothetical protein
MFDPSDLFLVAVWLLMVIAYFVLAAKFASWWRMLRSDRSRTALPLALRFKKRKSELVAGRKRIEARRETRAHRWLSGQSLTDDSLRWIQRGSVEP